MTTTVKDLRHFKLTKKCHTKKAECIGTKTVKRENLFDCFTFWKAKQLALLHVQLRNQHSQFDRYKKDKEKCMCSLGKDSITIEIANLSMRKNWLWRQDECAPYASWSWRKANQLKRWGWSGKNTDVLWVQKATKIRQKALHLAWSRLWPSSIVFWTNIKVGPTFWGVFLLDRNLDLRNRCSLSKTGLYLTPGEWGRGFSVGMKHFMKKKAKISIILSIYSIFG